MVLDAASKNKLETEGRMVENIFKIIYFISWRVM